MSITISLNAYSLILINEHIFGQKFNKTDYFEELIYVSKDGRIPINYCKNEYIFDKKCISDIITNFDKNLEYDITYKSFVNGEVSLKFNKYDLLALLIKLMIEETHNDENKDVNVILPYNFNGKDVYNLRKILKFLGYNLVNYEYEYNVLLFDLLYSRKSEIKNGYYIMLDIQKYKTLLTLSKVKDENVEVLEHEIIDIGKMSFVKLLINHFTEGKEINGKELSSKQFEQYIDFANLFCCDNMDIELERRISEDEDDDEDECKIVELTGKQFSELSNDYLTKLCEFIEKNIKKWINKYSFDINDVRIEKIGCAYHFIQLEIERIISEISGCKRRLFCALNRDTSIVKSGEFLFNRHDFKLIKHTNVIEEENETWTPDNLNVLFKDIKCVKKIDGLFNQFVGIGMKLTGRNANKYKEIRREIERRKRNINITVEDIEDYIKQIKELTN